MDVRPATVLMLDEGAPQTPYEGRTFITIQAPAFVPGGFRGVDVVTLGGMIPDYAHTGDRPSAYATAREAIVVSEDLDWGPFVWVQDVDWTVGFQDRPIVKIWRDQIGDLRRSSVWFEEAHGAEGLIEADELEAVRRAIEAHRRGGSAAGRAPDVTRALAAIQRHRTRLGMGPLDPKLAGWSDEDILREAERIARLPNPLRDPRAALDRLKDRLTRV